MGLLLGKLLSSISWGTKDYGILIIGLDNAGKTSILYKMKMGELGTTVPTIGFNVESMKYQNVSFTVWDVGGAAKVPALWRFYFDDIQGLIFVVDSNDKERMSEARDELHKVMENSKLSNIKLNVFANKQHLAEVLTTKEVTDRLHLSQLKQREWHVQACSAATGEGLRECLDWLAAALKDSPGRTSKGCKT